MNHKICSEIFFKFNWCFLFGESVCEITGLESFFLFKNG